MLGGKIVTMVQTTQTGSRNNSLCFPSPLGGMPVRRFFPQAEMRLVLMVIAHIFGQESF